MSETEILINAKDLHTGQTVKTFAGWGVVTGFRFGDDIFEKGAVKVSVNGDDHAINFADGALVLVKAACDA